MCQGYLNCSATHTTCPWRVYWIVEVRFDFALATPADPRTLGIRSPIIPLPAEPARDVSKAQRTMLPMQRLYAARAGGRHVASVAPRLSRALKSGTWMDRDMKYDT